MGAPFYPGKEFLPPFFPWDHWDLLKNSSTLLYFGVYPGGPPEGKALAPGFPGNSPCGKAALKRAAENWAS